MASARDELRAVLRDAMKHLAESDDFGWSKWDNASQAIAELQAHVDSMEHRELPPRSAMSLLFAPTGSIQEVSIDSGWGDAFISLAERFDRAAAKAYGSSAEKS